MFNPCNTFSAMLRLHKWTFLWIVLTGIAGCQKTDVYQSPPLSDYFNSVIGHYIEYRLDSTVFIFYGQRDTVVKYRAKDVVEAAIVDNLGRPSYRVVRYLSDTSGTRPWVPKATFMVTPSQQSLEVVDNNLRFQKLILPIKDSYTWKGNSYFDTYSIGSTVRYMDGWDYTYKNIHKPYSIWNNQTIDSTITIEQRNETIGSPSDSYAYSEKNISEEVYAKGVGLVYKNFLHWEYQPPNGGNPGYKTGYGIKLTMIQAH
jgi:hypothetical protein